MATPPGLHIGWHNALFLLALQHALTCCAPRLPTQLPCRCFPAEMLTEREEHAGDEERGQGRRGRRGVGDDEDWAAEDGAGGLLGRAFVAGYNAPTPAGGTCQ